MKKFIIVIFIFVVLGITFLGYNYINKPVQTSSSGILPVDVMVLQKSEFYPSLSFVSKIEAKDKVAVRARVTGFLTKRLFNEGDFVQEGQLLFEIEKDQFEANVRKAEANLANAKANEQNTSAQFKRAKNLIKTKDISEATLDQREAEYSSAEAGVKQAQSELVIAQLDLGYTDIKAPISGRIGESIYSVGSLIGPDSGELASIVSTTPMYAIFSVSENQLLQMREFIQEADKGHEQEGIDISFQFANGSIYAFPGKLNFVDIELDSQMNTLKMRASFPNPDNTLISGQYGRINMKFKNPQKALLVPQVAIQRDLAGAFVYVVNADNILESRRIETGLELTTGYTIVEKGLSIGDRILLNNYQKASRMLGIHVQPVIQKVADEKISIEEESQPEEAMPVQEEVNPIKEGK